MRVAATHVYAGLNPASHSKYLHYNRGPMYQGGDIALQATCGRFDSDGLHQCKFLGYGLDSAT